MALGALIGAVDELAALDPSLFADPDMIVALERQAARLNAVRARAAATFEAAKEWQADGARSAAVWLGFSANIPKSKAKDLVSVGRKLRKLPLCEAAWLAGDINEFHASVLCGALRAKTADAMARDEQMLVGLAKTSTCAEFWQAVRYWLQGADPDGSDKSEQDRIIRRDVYLAESVFGMWLGKMTLDPVSGTIVGSQLGRIEAELFAADWAEAKSRLGRTPTVDELVRTPAQRRADALVEMAVRSGTAPKDGKRPEPLFTVLVDKDTLSGRVCELAGGGVLSPCALDGWLPAAWVERVVFKGASRVLDVGVRSRLFEGATRRAVWVRDAGCGHRFCDVSRERCQVDHVIAYADGGLTVQDNGQMYCGWHNRDKEKRRGRPPDDPPAD